MADGKWRVEKTVFDLALVDGDEMTPITCYVLIKGDHNCPSIINGWRKRTFDRPDTVQDIVGRMFHEDDGVLFWEEGDPPLHPLETELAHNEGFLEGLQQQIQFK